MFLVMDAKVARSTRNDFPFFDTVYPVIWGKKQIEPNLFERNQAGRELILELELI